ncbi:MAG: YiiX/YebB-like N1pC/P60 family cysteine hydrolase [Planctomycetaceae bacterium]
MSVLLVAAALTIAVPTAAEYSSPEAAASFLGPKVHTGTLLISNGDCVAVKVFTRSRYTHIATVVKENGTTWVYESANGKGVQRQRLADYLEAETPNILYVLNPKRPFSKKRAKIYRQYLDSQLGRPYAIQHYFTGKRAAGVHCSEYVTDALMRCRIIRAKQPSRVTPASLAVGVLQANLYAAECSLELTEAVERPEARNRCERMWIDTKTCTLQLCLQLRRWFACR